MATKPRSLTFGVKCVRCSDPDAVLSINVNDVGSITCSACEESFGAEEARGLVAAELARWSALCKWIQLAGECLAE